MDEGARRFERIANFRDLGGHVTRDGRRVATGRLFRSGHLAHATEADRRVLAQLGLRRVFDFRTQADVGIEGPDRLPDGVVSVALPMADPAMGHGIRSLLAESSPERIEAHFGNGKAEAMMRSSAAGLVRERREPYGAFLRALAEPGAFPALFHCSAGKDRAGWAGSVVLLCLGVPEEQVIEQYLRSNRATEEILARYRAHGREGWSDVLRPLLEVRREYIEAAFAAVAQDWGDSDRYLEDGLGITAALRDAIRENLLDGRG